MILTQCPWPTHIPTVCSDQFYWNLAEKKTFSNWYTNENEIYGLLNGSNGCCSCFWRKPIQGLISKCRQIVLAKYKFVTSFCSVRIIWNHLLFREPEGIATGERVGSARLLWKSSGNYVDKVALKNVAMQFKIVSIYHQKDLYLWLKSAHNLCFVSVQYHFGFRLWQIALEDTQRGRSMPDEKLNLDFGLANSAARTPGQCSGC